MIHSCPSYFSVTVKPHVHVLTSSTCLKAHATFMVSVHHHPDMQLYCGSSFPQEAFEIFICFPCQQKSLLFNSVSPGGMIRELSVPGSRSYPAEWLFSLQLEEEMMCHSVLQCFYIYTLSCVIVTSNANRFCSAIIALSSHIFTTVSTQSFSGFWNLWIHQRYTI